LIELTEPVEIIRRDHEEVSLEAKSESFRQRVAAS